MAAELICNPAGHAPERRRHSVRRTSSLDTTWPGGREGDLHIEGRCRDLITGDALDNARIAREDTMRAHLGWDRVIHKIENDRVDLSPLLGARGGGHLRAVLDEHIHVERVNGTPLYLLLDDISGVSLVSGWSWSRWDTDWMNQSSFGNPEERSAMMANICTGFAPGSSALSADHGPQNNPQVLPLARPDDDFSWHALPAANGAGFRRARRIDVWREGDSLIMDVGFQDSASDPNLERVAIHEYRVTGRADARTGVLEEIAATPHVLPFPECPGAVANIQLLLGTPLQEMRTKVIDTLPGTLGCTHLNDLLRGLAEVPVLVSFL